MSVGFATSEHTCARARAFSRPSALAARPFASSEEAVEDFFDTDLQRAWESRAIDHPAPHFVAPCVRSVV